MTYLEAAFPYRDVSRLVAADRRSPDPAYQAHRWWARRPPALLRSVLLAATLPADTSERDYWQAYASAEPHLAEYVVADPFLGGGTTLVEAARLGARVRGSDVDPLAVVISEHQLDPPRAADVIDAGARLIEHLSRKIGRFWAGVTDPDGSAWRPLHYFSVAEVTCPDCSMVGPLYRSLVLARSVGHAGSVVRSVQVTAFCPHCYALHDLGADDHALVCCGERHALTSATYKGSRYRCPNCDSKSSHERLQSGVAPRRLIAVEDTPGTNGSTRAGYRRLRAPRPSDRAAVTAATNWVARHPDDDRAARALVPGPNDNRPLSYGIATVGSLHTNRQLAYLSEAMAWTDTADLPNSVARAIRLALSTTITSNTRLCGYATDYGRLAPLFSIRAFSLPWLTVELNPLNPVGGRGTLKAAISRVVRSCEDRSRRHVFASNRRIAPAVLELPRRRDGHVLTCTDSTAPTACAGTPGEPLADLCITDPPYFDFIPYDTLSQVFRAWQPDAALTGTPLLPGGDDPVTDFGTRLGSALADALTRCKDGALVAFTYKGDSDAWDAVGVALDEAKLRVTALWPVLADPHMGHHTHDGNCEYDVLVVARSILATSADRTSVPNPDTLIRELRKARHVSDADATNIRAAVLTSANRWGLPASD